jgi:hypothetical protein
MTDIDPNNAPDLTVSTDPAPTAGEPDASGAQPGTAEAPEGEAAGIVSAGVPTHIPAVQPPESVMTALRNLFDGAETHAVTDLEHVHAWFSGVLAKIKTDAEGARDWLTIEESRVRFAADRGVSAVMVMVGDIKRMVHRDEGL